MQKNEWGYINKMQNVEAPRQCDVNTDITNIITNLMIINKNNNCKINYFVPGPSQETDRRASVKVA